MASRVKAWDIHLEIMGLLSTNLTKNMSITGKLLDLEVDSLGARFNILKCISFLFFAME